jgi:phosphatidylinositol glycan class K
MLLILALCIRALLVSTSSKWFNYRHAANAFAVASLLLANSVPRSDIFLAVADDPAHSPRNPLPGRVFLESPLTRDIHVAPNLTGDSVSVATLRALLMRGPVRGRMTRLSADGSGRMLLYLTGHGGEEFLKFRNAEELRATEFAAVLAGMKRALNFTELLVVLDTCQAASFFRHIAVAGVTAIASSVAGESSKSSGYDPVLGVPLCDRFTHALCRVLPSLPRTATLADLRSALRGSNFDSTVAIEQFNATRPLSEMPLGDFFF